MSFIVGIDTRLGVDAETEEEAIALAHDAFIELLSKSAEGRIGWEVEWQTEEEE